MPTRCLPVQISVKTTHVNDVVVIMAIQVRLADDLVGVFSGARRLARGNTAHFALHLIPLVEVRVDRKLIRKQGIAALAAVTATKNPEFWADPKQLPSLFIDGSLNTRFSYYASAASITPQFYQSLLDRGWRRSGVLLYKPDQRASCCPHYTIRLDSEEFRASKDQRQVQNRFNKYVLGDFYIKEAARLYPLSREQARKRNTEFQLTQRVRECEQNQLQTPPEPAHRFVVTLEPDVFTEEKYTLFENYQRLVHNEPPHRITKSGLKNFLCSSPIPRDETAVDGQKIGSYHQCYRLDGKLVAIGVLDLLPKCVSAVYFMYDESVHQHAFGKLGALREISLANEGNYKYWYAGFYIHSCAKMRYKGDYTPQHLLDPESYDWNILDTELKQKLDKTKYFSMSRERSSLAADSSEIPGTQQNTDTVIDSKIFEDGADFDFDEHNPLSDPGTPLFSRSIPGILTKTQLLNEVDLDSIKISVRGVEAEAKDLVSWESSDIDSPGSTKCIISELAAAVGPVLAMGMIVKFG